MKNVEFHNLVIPVADLHYPRGKQVAHAWHSSWTRIEIDLPEVWSAPEKVVRFINDNIDGGRWGWFTLQGGEHELALTVTMVICFEIEEDAVMFKLLGGYAAWENDEEAF